LDKIDPAITYDKKRQPVEFGSICFFSFTKPGLIYGELLRDKKKVPIVVSSREDAIKRVEKLVKERYPEFF
jgi:hypothetical protein